MILVKPILPDSCLLPMYSYWGESFGISLSSFKDTSSVRSGLHFITLFSLKLNYLLKDSCLQDSHVELGLQHTNFGRTQAFSPQYFPVSMKEHRRAFPHWSKDGGEGRRGAVGCINKEDCPSRPALTSACEMSILLAPLPPALSMRWMASLQR